MTRLNPFLVDDGGVHLEDGRLDGARRRQLGHADVDGVGPLVVQHHDLLGSLVLLLLLKP